MRKLPFALTIALFCLTGLIAFLYVESEITRAQQSNNPRIPALFRNLNDKAAQVKTTTNFNSAESQTQVRGLVNETFQVMRLEGLPSTLIDSLKDRVTRSEIKYRKGEFIGVQEVDVVRAINGLMIKFTAPEWAKTYDDEIKSSKVGLAELCPNLVTFSGSGESARISSVMSPTEAAYLFSLLFEQKRSNGLFQMTYLEKKQFQTQNAYQLSSLENKAENAERQNELNVAIVSSLRNMTDAEILELPQRSLDILGIER